MHGCTVALTAMSVSWPFGCSAKSAAHLRKSSRSADRWGTPRPAEAAARRLEPSAAVGNTISSTLREPRRRLRAAVQNAPPSTLSKQTHKSAAAASSAALARERIGRWPAGRKVDGWCGSRWRRMREAKPSSAFFRHMPARGCVPPLYPSALVSRCCAALSSRSGAMAAPSALLLAVVRVRTAACARGPQQPSLLDALRLSRG